MAASGWYADPTRRHELRYFDGSKWTAHVADRGQMAADPLGPPPPPPAVGGPTATSAGGSFKTLGKWADKQMQSAAGWVAQRGATGKRGDPAVLDHGPDGSILGQWSGLAGAVQKLAVAASGVRMGSELVGVLRAVVGAEDAQGRLLSSIDAKVDALVKGPYNTGRTYLYEAQRLGPDDPETRNRVERAKDAFYLAHGQAASVQSRALVEYHIGLTWLLLGRREDAVHWLARSHASVVAVVEELARHAENVKVLRSQAGVAAAAYFYPAGAVVLGMKFKKMVAAERARHALVEMLPFVDCVARSHNSLVNAPAEKLASFSLVEAGEHTYELTSTIA